MNLNFTEDLRHHAWLLWLLVALLCAAIEVVRRDRWFLALAIGFAVAGVVALASDVAGVIAGLVAMVGAWWWVRRQSRRS